VTKAKKLRIWQFTCWSALRPDLVGLNFMHGVKSKTSLFQQKAGDLVVGSSLRKELLKF